MSDSSSASSSLVVSIEIRESDNALRSVEKAVVDPSSDLALSLILQSSGVAESLPAGSARKVLLGLY